MLNDNMVNELTAVFGELGGEKAFAGLYARARR